MQVSDLINCGVYVFSTEIFSAIQDVSKHREDKVTYFFADTYETLDIKKNGYHDAENEVQQETDDAQDRVLSGKLSETSGYAGSDLYDDKTYRASLHQICFHGFCFIKCRQGVAANRMGVNAASCLVIEDSLSPGKERNTVRGILYLPSILFCVVYDYNSTTMLA
ncbi:hypothetical protein POM88_050341 [Heracleum sosnowskyi]|uniref:Uncharacterized protein n=1 Tax=Heracleum sosnowskyi TaxID=360622 RepID=A0AAD8GZY9_9APIA|nr:hypothetical protein POM88_050341 [Heracleum sosnowskyi]